MKNMSIEQKTNYEIDGISWKIKKNGAAYLKNSVNFLVTQIQGMPKN
jgi:hypothetical protein